MLIGISAAKQQSTVVQYLAAQGFKVLTMEALEAGALAERVVVEVSSEIDAELVRWSNGVVVHLDRMESGAGLLLSPLGRNVEDLEILAFEDVEACQLVSEVVGSMLESTAA